MSTDIKPFKLNATYKLREKHLHDFSFSCDVLDFCVREYHEFYHCFTGTVVKIHENWVELLLSDGKTSCYASVNERHMFKRIDNK